MQIAITEHCKHKMVSLHFRRKKYSGSFSDFRGQFGTTWLVDHITNRLCFIFCYRVITLATIGGMSGNWQASWRCIKLLIKNYIYALDRYACNGSRISHKWKAKAIGCFFGKEYNLYNKRYSTLFLWLFYFRIFCWYNIWIAPDH